MSDKHVPSGPRRKAEAGSGDLDDNSHVHPTPRVSIDLDTLKQMAEGDGAYARILQSQGIASMTVPKPVDGRRRKVATAIEAVVPPAVPAEDSFEKALEGAPDYVKPDLRRLFLECHDRVEFHRLYREFRERNSRFLAGLQIWIFRLQSSRRRFSVPSPDMGFIDREGWRISGCCLSLLDGVPVPRIYVRKRQEELDVDLVYIFQGLRENS